MYLWRLKTGHKILQVISLLSIALFCYAQVYAHQKPEVTVVSPAKQGSSCDCDQHLKADPALHQVFYGGGAHTYVAKSVINRLYGTGVCCLSCHKYNDLRYRTFPILVKAYIGHIYPTHTFW